MNYLNNKQFVKTYVQAYKEGKTSVDVAQKLNVDLKKVYVKANTLGKRGVNLPILKQASPLRNDLSSADDLNAYIESL